MSQQRWAFRPTYGIGQASESESHQRGEGQPGNFKHRSGWTLFCAVRGG